MYNNNYNRPREVRREVDNKPQYVVPSVSLSAPLMTNKVCVYTCTYTNDKGMTSVAYQTLDFGFVCRVSSVYEADEDGFIEYDPLHALFNTKGSVPTLYILKSDRLNKMKNIKKEEPLEDTGASDLGIEDITEEDLPF